MSRNRTIFARRDVAPRTFTGTDDLKQPIVRRDMSGGMNSRQHPSMIAENEAKNLTNVDIAIPGERKRRPGNTQIDELGNLPITGAVGFDPQGATANLLATHGTNLSRWEGTGYFSLVKTDFTTSLPTKIIKAYKTGTGDVALVSNGTDNVFQMAPTTYAMTDLGDTNTSPPKTTVMTTYRNRVWALKNDLLYFSGASPSDYAATFDRTTNNYRLPVGSERAVVGARDLGLLVAGKEQIWGLNPSVTPAATDKPEKISEYGCASGETFKQVGDDYYYMSFDGVRGIKRTEQDKLQYGVSWPISYRLKDELESINWAYITKACSIYWDNKYFIALPTGSATYNNQVWVYYPSSNGWVVIDGWDVGVWATFKVSGEERLYFGDATRGGFYRAWSGISDQTPGAVDSYTKLLLHCQGLDDGTTFTDSSSRANTVTAVNAVTSVDQYKFGGSAGYFDGTGDYLTVPSDQQLSNGNFETWSGGASAAPDGWTLGGVGASIAREATTIKIGTYSAKLTRAGADASIYQAVASIVTGETTTFGCWVYATVAGRARIGVITDGTGTSYSSYHTGDSTWQYLTVTAVIGGAVTYVRGTCLVDTGDTTAYFDGAFVTDDAAANFNIYGSDFTIDTWAYFTDVTTATYREICSNYDATGNDRGFALAWSQSDGYLYLFYMPSTGTQTSKGVSWTPTINTWHHIEVGRNGNNLYFFVDGTQVGATQDLTGVNILPSNTTFKIGAVDSTPDQFFIGYLDEFRFSKGICRHTAAFTPPTLPYPTYTSTAIEFTEEGRSEDLGNPIIKKYGGEFKVKAKPTGDYNISVYGSFDNGPYNLLGYLNVNTSLITFPATFPWTFSPEAESYKKFPLDYYGEWYTFRHKLYHNSVTTNSDDINIYETSLVSIPQEYDTEEEN